MQMVLVQQAETLAQLVLMEILEQQEMQELKVHLAQMVQVQMLER